MSINTNEAAQVWFDDLLLVVTPDSLSIKNDNTNENTQSVDGTPITIPRRDKAQQFTLSFFIPYLLDNYASPYYCFQNSNIRNIKDFTDYIWWLKVNKTPFKLTIDYPGAQSICGEFLLQDYEYTQDATNGSDYAFSVTLVEYYPAQNLEVSAQLNNSLIDHGIRNPRRLD